MIWDSFAWQPFDAMRAVEMLKERQNSRSAHNQLQSQAIGEFLSKNRFRFNGSDVLVFVPVYNEEHTVAKVVKGIRDCCNFDLLVIDPLVVSRNPSSSVHLGS